MLQLPKLQLPPWALLLGGVAAISLLLYLGYDEDISRRVALALAAAAIASYIPGLIQVNSNVVRASGALAVLVLVLFAEDISRSLSPSPKTPGVPTNVKLNKDQLQYQSEIASAQFEISQENYQTAVETLEHARKIKPGDQLAQHMLGNLYFHYLGNYTKAAQSFEEGYRAGGSERVRFAYNAALAHDALGQTEQAREWIDRAYEIRASLREDYPALWRDITYNRGLFYLLSWANDGTPQQNKIYEAAIFAFHEFLNAGAPVLHWADYHLACLHASMAVHEMAKEKPSKDLLNKSADHMDKFLRRLGGVVDLKKLAYHKGLARNVLADRASEKRLPGEAAACPVIRKAWEAAGRDWVEVSRQLWPTEQAQPTLPTRL